MEFEPISAVRMVAFMAAGGLFAVVGLYMMVRPRAGDAAKVELFGLKFESSSAGLLVFIVGAVFLAVPLFVPERQSAPETGSAPDSPDAEELEPNDVVQQANQLNIGSTVAGEVRRNQVDWYVIPTGGHMDKRLVVKLRKVSGSMVNGEIFDSDERRVAQIGWVSTGAGVEDWYVVGARAYVRVVGDFVRDGPVAYELTSRIEDD